MQTDYPVKVEIGYEPKRSRLKTAFRPILAIPIVLWTALVMLGVGFAVIAAWFALLFTGRYPQGIYDFVTKGLSLSARLNAYAFLLTDDYPPFALELEIDYPARVDFDPPLETYSRLKVGFRWLIGIPLALFLYILQLISYLVYLSWLVIVISGRQPEWLQRYLRFYVGYNTQAGAYFTLVTERYPPIPAPLKDAYKPANELAAPGSVATL